MYSLIRSMSLRQLLFQLTPSFGLSLIIAELFYKFHSFTIECAAFLATWFAIDWVLGRALGAARLVRSGVSTRE